MPDKYMTLQSGKKVLKEATDSSGGSGDAGELVALDSNGLINENMLPAVDVKNVESSENLTAGDYVNIFLDGGVAKARRADNSNGRPSHGFVKDAVTAPATVNVYRGGCNTNLSGLTIGSRLYLGETGDVISTPLDPTDPANDTKIHQFLGIAVSATESQVEIQDCIELSS